MSRLSPGQILDQYQMAVWTPNFNLLAVDFGLNSAWAYGSCKADLKLGHWRLGRTLKKGQKERPRERYRRFRKYLDELMDAVARNAEAIAHEAIARQAHRSTSAACCYFNYFMELAEFAHDHDLEVRHVAPSRIRRIVVGRGACPKDELEAATKRLYPDLLISTPDEADAVAIWHSVQREAWEQRA